jgi:hypothetical protein
VVQVAAHERYVLVQCAIHKNLHFKNSITRLFRQLAQQELNAELLQAKAPRGPAVNQIDPRSENQIDPVLKDIMVTDSVT